MALTSYGGTSGRCPQFAACQNFVFFLVGSVSCFSSLGLPRYCFCEMYMKAET